MSEFRDKLDEIIRGQILRFDSEGKITHAEPEKTKQQIIDLIIEYYTPKPTWSNLALVRFFSKVDVENTKNCWIWKAGKTSKGYGAVNSEVYGTGLAHKALYEFTFGKVPEGLQLDHLCRNPACINPSHLEPVTPAENTFRGEVAKRTRTHCKYGHSFDEWGTFIKNKKYLSCKLCARMWSTRSVAKKKATDARK